VSIKDLRRAWLEVDTDALRRNYRRISRHVGPERALLPMVKADGYGLGALRVTRALAEEDPWGLGVATAAEGEELRDAGWEGRIVAFSPCPAEEATDMVEADIEACVSSPEGLRELARAAGARSREAGVHLNLDTGMGRLGFDADRVDEWAEEVRSVIDGSPLRLVSTFTHYHSAEADDAASEAQWTRFRRALRSMERNGLDPGLRHAANSAAAVRWPERAADVVRPGIFLYGASPAGGELHAEAVVRLRARVLEVRRVTEGTTVSYGATYRTPGPSRLATLGLGYGDGLRRSLSNRGVALIHGRRVPVRGRVCMDMTVVDVTDGPEVRPGDVATLLGHDGESEIRLEELASTCDTIAHEILTGFTNRLPRVPAEEAPASASSAPEGPERSST